jgi:hypothetical protein
VPFSILGVAEPVSLSNKIIVGVLEFGDNFVLYGSAGVLVGLRFRKRLDETIGQMTLLSSLQVCGGCYLTRSASLTERRGKA